MFESDYLMRMIMQLFEAITRSMNKANGEKDPATAAEMLEAAVGTATELDGAVLLSLAPESIASILEVSGTDPSVAEYVGRSLHLEALYLRDANDSEKADLREAQAKALADAYGFELDSQLPADEAMTRFMEAQQAEEQQPQEDLLDDSSSTTFE